MVKENLENCACYFLLSVVLLLYKGKLYPSQSRFRGQGISSSLVKICFVKDIQNFPQVVKNRPNSSLFRI